MVERESVGQFMKRLREHADVSQSDVARRLGYNSPQFVSNWERGLARPPIISLKLLAKVYRVRPQIIVNKLVQEYREELLAAVG